MASIQAYKGIQESFILNNFANLLPIAASEDITPRNLRESL